MNDLIQVKSDVFADGRNFGRRRFWQLERPPAANSSFTQPQMPQEMIFIHHPSHFVEFGAAGMQLLTDKMTTSTAELMDEIRSRKPLPAAVTSPPT